MHDQCSLPQTNTHTHTYICVFLCMEELGNLLAYMDQADQAMGNPFQIYVR